MGPAAIVVYKHPLRHTSHPSSEAEMEDLHLAALQNQLTDSKRCLAVACTRMSEFAGAFILLIQRNTQACTRRALIRSVAVPAALLLSKWQRSCRRSSLVVVLRLVGR